MDNENEKKPITCPLLEELQEKMVEMEEHHKEDMQALRDIVQ